MFELLVIERKRKILSPSSINLYGKESNNYGFDSKGISKILYKGEAPLCQYSSGLNYIFDQRYIKLKLLSGSSIIEFAIPPMGLLHISEKDTKFRYLSYEVLLDGNLLGSVVLQNLSFLPWLETYSVSSIDETIKQEYIDVLIFSLFVVFCEKSTYVGT
jgi:hypothetical protein